ncbi:phage protein [Lacticaseibacillus rhamnosus]|jgi:hypothetical protein|uniref:hypothetical protein n=1 Tax=Lacticaseibacillus rhamnosus TaxID=47715 RepID=UPI00065AAB21|nr:hypothetical protein [Lacticaseibacillus rhamnosus]KMO46911.1 phage protein [Lacticaseibacillus rhamnosus]MDA3725689.1 hypothetical protein [Lacticaseibacillus rhamnosus]MDA3736790.1 hypothetical protein [Lacticaseibacillus rhamnosus]MDA3741769.1 hypothetical protein [Lacticaseibacillus rhamnosus]MDA3744268.1 hypothetical protein [Lacticaseibacillus rhamnosus]
MSNETKRDVFEAVWNRLAGYQVFFNGWPRETLDGYKKRYDAALPDDLPMIPKMVGDYIKELRKYHRDLVDVLGMVRDLGITRTVVTGALAWIAFDADTFALAWLLGVWRVEETGEIVKLEVKE